METVDNKEIMWYMYISTMWSLDKDYVLLNIQIAYTAVWLQIAQPYFSIVCIVLNEALLIFLCNYGIGIY